MTERLVLLSGGLDSATLLGALVSELGGSEHLHTISFAYGQKHSVELELADKLAAFYSVKSNVTMDLPSAAFAASNSPLLKHSTESVPVSAYRDLPEGMVPTYVPFRNGIMLATAATYAFSEGYDVLYFGAQADDIKGGAYPDCSPSFLYAMGDAISSGTDKRVELLVPFQFDNKAEVVELGLKLKVPYELTITCHNGTIPACGICPACRSRIEAFERNGAKDPIEYEMVRNA